MAIHETILSIVVYSEDGESTLKDIFLVLKKNFKLQNISSIYLVSADTISSRQIHALDKVESFTGLCVAARAQTELSEQEAMQELKAIEQEFVSYTQRHSIQIFLSVYDNLTLMVPDLNLPFTDLHSRPELLIPASEVWGDYFHPILKENLTVLAAKLNTEHWGKFYGLGKSLLDFSASAE